MFVETAELDVKDTATMVANPRQYPNALHAEMTKIMTTTPTISNVAASRG